jgi:hypothetical protein
LDKAKTEDDASRLKERVAKAANAGKLNGPTVPPPDKTDDLWIGKAWNAAHGHFGPETDTESHVHAPEKYKSDKKWIDKVAGFESLSLTVTKTKPDGSHVPIGFITGIKGAIDVHATELNGRSGNGLRLKGKEVMEAISPKDKNGKPTPPNGTDPSGKPLTPGALDDYEDIDNVTIHLDGADPGTDPKNEEDKSAWDVAKVANGQVIIDMIDYKHGTPKPKK